MLAQIIRLKVWVAQRLCSPFVGRIINVLWHSNIPSRGFYINTANTSITPSIRASLFWGFYESNEIRYIQRYLRSDLDVVELGSSLGVLTCHIRKHVDQSHRVIAVEANPYLIDSIQLNLEQNGLFENVEIVNSAVAYTENPIYLSSKDSNHISKFVMSSNYPLADSISIPKTTLTSILHNYNIQKYVLVCDIEGSEALILEHDALALKDCEQIIIEFHNTDLTNQSITVDELIERTIHQTKLQLFQRYGPVCVFNRL